jgi:hypothetical protein
LAAPEVDEFTEAVDEETKEIDVFEDVDGFGLGPLGVETRIAAPSTAMIATAANAANPTLPIAVRLSKTLIPPVADSSRCRLERI